jgi:Protein of unknown function (DUF3987)
MSETPINRLIGRLHSHGCNPRETGSGQWKSRCPAHKGRSSNLSIKQADDGAVILHCHHVDATGQTCSAEAVVRSLGLEMRDLFPEKLGSPLRKPKAAATPSRNGNGKAWRSPEDAIAWHAKTIKGRVSERGPWIYKDPERFELMRVYRIDYRDPETGEPRKQFRPVYPDAADCWHVGDPSKDRLPLYHLDELTAAGLVYVCEGEKCADLVRGLGLVATTSSHGAQAPGKTDWSPLAGKTVVILPDHDGAGEGYAAAVAGILAGLDPRPTIKVVRLPVEGEGDDVEQWLEGRPDSWGPEECRAELEGLTAETPEWKPDPSSVIPADEDGEDEVVRDPIGDPHPRAFHGPLGRLALDTQRETEANPLFVMLHLMVFFGTYVGRVAGFVISGSLHYTNLFVALIGISGRGRKGTAADVAKAIWRKIDPIFTQENITNGLNSGAGLLTDLRDPSINKGKKGEPVVDEGVADKRRVYLQSELATILKQGQRETEILLELLRALFDGEECIGSKRSKTEDSRKVTGAHVSLIGHCTPDDLRSYLTDTDKANGTFNRFLCLFGLRSKRLKSGGDIFGLIDSGALNPDLQKLTVALERAKAIKRIRRDPSIKDWWENTVYDALDDIPPGRLGGLFVRAIPIVMRMADTLAMADLADFPEILTEEGVLHVQKCHIEAALAIWEHSGRSLRFLFEADADPKAEKLLAEIKKKPDGLTKRQISRDVFKGHMNAKNLNELLRRMLAYRQIELTESASTGGRPAERYRLPRN